MDDIRAMQTCSLADLISEDSAGTASSLCSGSSHCRKSGARVASIHSCGTKLPPEAASDALGLRLHWLSII